MIELGFIRTLTEARTPHPEDFIFSGKQEALNAIQGIVGAVKQPQTVSIKWDGSPSIIFGRRLADGKFTMNYKEYIALPGGQVTSGEELLQFFQSLGKNMDVGQKLAHIFNSVASIVPAGFKGFVQGDVMWATLSEIGQEGNTFMFKPNPHGVTYKVDKTSPTGKKIADREVGLAIHTGGTDVEKTSKGTELVGKHSLNGLGGLSDTNEYITVFTGNMGNTFKLNVPERLRKNAEKAVTSYGDIVDLFLASLTQTTKDRLQQYYNRKYTNQPVDAAWLEGKLTKPQYAIVSAEENKPALQGLDAIYSSIYQLKLGILDQLEPQVQGIGQEVNGVQKGEGFNIDSPSGFIKLVNRGVFSAANFAGRAQ